VRLLPELGGSKVERDDFAAVEIADEIQSSHGVAHCWRHRTASGDVAKEIPNCPLARNTVSRDILNLLDGSARETSHEGDVSSYRCSAERSMAACGAFAAV
jgi:hypothetical protein